jgi:nickel/cobalt transporter (NiCoT) family protein
LIRLWALLAVINGAAWIALLAAAHRFPLLLPLGITAYVLGLRHAVDPDHLAAIDGTTRKLLHEGRRSETVGFYFSLGHSTIVFALCVLVALFGVAIKERVPMLGTIGSLAGTWISAIFLFAVAAMNVAVLIAILKHRNDREPRLAGAFLARLLRPALRVVTRAEQMYPVGVLFGLGFDTATEIALLAISAASGAGGMPLFYVFLLPWLFTAGMSLVDTSQGIAMLRVYEWACARPSRGVFYSAGMTVLTIAIAFAVGGVEIAAALGGPVK